MSNKSDINLLYRFLASFDSKGGWEKAADSESFGGDGDGIVIKWEFTNFVQKNLEGWDGNANNVTSLPKDVINEFWNKFDTNKSASKIGKNVYDGNALNKTELANLDKQLEIYVEYEEFVKEHVKNAPSVVGSYGGQWLAEVRNELGTLVDKFVNDGATGDLESYLLAALPDIANNATATWCQVQYMKSLERGALSGYKDYVYSEDSTLNSLISYYVADLVGNTTITPEQIKADIQNIINTYLATAGISAGTPADYNINSLGYDSSSINGIQVAVIAKKIKADLAKEAKQYADYPNEFNKAVEDFIKEQLSKGGTFESLKSSASLFMTSSQKTILDKVIDLKTRYMNIEAKAEDAFYNTLVSEFGTTIADAIAKSERSVGNGAYKELLESAIQALQSGELQADDVEQYILDGIRKNLSAYVGGDLSKMSVSELNTLYDNLAENAESQEDDAVYESEHRNAATLYCDALVKKGGKYAELVKEHLGSDYKSGLAGMDAVAVKELMSEIKTSALEIVDVSSLKIDSWSGIEDNLTMAVGTSDTFHVRANIATDNEETIPEEKISYSAVSVSGGGKVTIDTLGNLTINTSSTNGYMTVNIYLVVDGVKVGSPKTVKIKCIEAMDLTKENDARVQGRTFAQILADGTDSLELCDFAHWGTWQGSAKTRMATLIAEIGDALIAEGYDETTIEKTVKTTTNYYNAAIDNMSDQKWSKGYKIASYTFTYVNADGTDITEKDATYLQKTYKYKGSADGNSNTTGKTTTGLQLSETYNWSPNGYKLYIQMSDLINKFQSFYNAM